MKRFLIFSALLTALVSCTKAEVSQTPDERSGEAAAFEAGQEVTITVGTTIGSGDEDGTSSRMSFSTLTPEGNIALSWEDGDQISVTVHTGSGDKSSVFTMVSRSGKQATFKGHMPAAGTTFSVNYPANGTAPDLSVQNYVAGCIQKDKLQLEATGCTLGSTIYLAAVQSVLRLNFWGTGVILDSVVVTNTTASPNAKYKLVCSPAVTVGSTSATATPFLIVVPATTGSVGFTAEAFPIYNETTPITYNEYSSDGTTVVYSGTGIPITVGSTCTSFSSSKTFNAGRIMNMAVREVSAIETIIWAPVNCGYHPTDYQYGKLYQWGRKYGQGYGNDSTVVHGDPIHKDATYPSGSQISSVPWSGANGLEDADSFYASSGLGHRFAYDWIMNGSNDFWDKSGNSQSTEKIIPEKNVYDPCPAGWRVPTYYELNRLLGGDTASSLETGTHGSVTGLQGYYLNGTGSASSSSNPVVFLPAAGGCDGGRAVYREDMGMYWTSTLGSDESDTRFDISDDNYAYYLGFMANMAGLALIHRDGGFTIRCVQQSGGIGSDEVNASLGSLTHGTEQSW